MNPLISIIIPSYNPDEGILQRVLDALYEQTISSEKWELIIVNNASTQWPAQDFFAKYEGGNIRILVEAQQGATYARKRGLEEASADLAVLVDDDNILGKDYLEKALIRLQEYPQVGALGGRVKLEFLKEPPVWMDTLHGLFASWDHGDTMLISNGIRPPGATRNEYPPFAPITAGLVLRRAAWEAWLAHLNTQPIMSDRCGDSLSSGGDNDAILAILKSGWEVAYLPEIYLTNIIPPFRLTPKYLERLSYGCSAGFTQALRRHDACPWPPIARWTLPLRVARAWFRYRAWRGPANKIHWRGAVGHFTARVR